jgi:hypothetical protein
MRMKYRVKHWNEIERYIKSKNRLSQGEVDKLIEVGLLNLDLLNCPCSSLSEMEALKNVPLVLWENVLMFDECISGIEGVLMDLEDPKTTPCTSLDFLDEKSGTKSKAMNNSSAAGRCQLYEQTCSFGFEEKAS